MSKVLITGASGLIGTRLTEMLLQKGYEVAHLSRSKGLGLSSSEADEVPTFVWDVNAGTVDQAAFCDVDAVVHLAGAGVADQRWTEKRKREILESRTKSAALLAKGINGNQHVKVVVAASGIGYYGEGTHHVFTEADGQGRDFLAGVVDSWEKEVDKIPCKRIVKLRTGIVLSEKDGALKKMMTPVKFFAGAPLGSGDQYMSWIHIDDLCSMYIKSIEDEAMRGVYNATSLYAVTNTELTRAIARVLKRPLWLPNVPAFVLKALLGEMADMVLTGSQVSSKKIQQTGFQFQFPDLNQALENLVQKK